MGYSYQMREKTKTGKSKIIYIDYKTRKKCLTMSKMYKMNVV